MGLRRRLLLGDVFWREAESCGEFAGEAAANGLLAAALKIAECVDVAAWAHLADQLSPRHAEDGAPCADRVAIWCHGLDWRHVATLWV
jgi:hypothetical protein